MWIIKRVVKKHFLCQAFVKMSRKRPNISTGNAGANVLYFKVILGIYNTFLMFFKHT